MKRNIKKKIKKIVIISISVLVGAIILISFYIIVSLNRRISEKEINVRIPKKATLTQIVEIFNSKGILKPKEMFVPLLKIYCFVKKCNPVAGTYKFNSSNSNLDVIKAIISGKQLSIVKVTYPEGITLSDFALITQKFLDIDTTEFFEEIRKSKYIEKLNIPINSLEGYLMPETYFFFKDSDPKIVIERLVETQNKIWKQKFDSMAKKKGLSRHFILTLASIIELESPLESERKTISGVFYNRLARNMKLESDPTVQYAAKSKKITHKELKINNLYNTYRNEGLPPGPICSPSISSIEAALNPEKNEFLYFVAFGDGSGRHRFAKTFQEHLKYKRLYRKELKKQIPSVK